jgi:hypothetical protein
MLCCVVWRKLTSLHHEGEVGGNKHLRNINFYENTQCNIPEGSNLYTHCNENLISTSRNGENLLDNTHETHQQFIKFIFQRYISERDEQKTTFHRTMKNPTYIHQITHNVLYWSEGIGSFCIANFII